MQTTAQLGHHCCFQPAQHGGRVLQDLLAPSQRGEKAVEQELRAASHTSPVPANKRIEHQFGIWISLCGNPLPRSPLPEEPQNES